MYIKSTISIGETIEEADNMSGSKPNKKTSDKHIKSTAKVSDNGLFHKCETPTQTTNVEVNVTVNEKRPSCFESLTKCFSRAKP